MAKLACDQLCQRMRQHFASIDGACGSMLLAYAAHTVANCQRRRRMWQQNRVKMSFCKRMRRMRQDFASICGSTLLAYATHAVATCQCMRVQIAIVYGACGCKLLAYATHAVSNCQRMRRMRQQIASVDGACSSTLLAYAAHAVTKCQRRRPIRQQFASVDSAYGSEHKMATISPICKKCKKFISALKSPTYRDFQIKKIIKIQDIKISHLGTFKAIFFAGKILITHGGSVPNSSQKKFECIMITELDVTIQYCITFL